MFNTGIIFDMDGLLIDSEPFWCQAEVEIFNDLGVPLEKTMCIQTLGLRIDEVVAHWYTQFPWIDVSPETVSQRLIERVAERVARYGKAMTGAIEVVELCQSLDLPLALATSSPMILVRSTLQRLNLQDTFDVLSSAENEDFGKPHPAVYLTAARDLGIHPSCCIAFEDSITGMTSAKAAGMKCIVVPAAEERNNPEFLKADRQINSLGDLDHKWFKELLSQNSALNKQRLKNHNFNHN